jgi:hypothetical protein
MWLIYAHAGGLKALMVAFALIGAMTFGFVYLTCAGLPFIAVPLTLLSYWTSRFLWGSRPQIFNIFMLALLMWILESVRQKRFGWKGLYVLPFLFMVWANLHSGYLMGITVLWIFLAGDKLQTFLWKSDEGVFAKPVLKHLAIVIVLSVLAAMVNPSGYNILLYPFATLTSKMMQSSILEWLTPDFHHWNYKPFIISMGLGAIAFMASRRRRNITEMVLYAGTLAAGLISRRHIPFFAIVAIPSISRAILDSLEGSKWQDFFAGRTLPRKIDSFYQLVCILLVALSLAGCALWTTQQMKKNDAEIRDKYPVEAVKFLKDRNLQGLRGFNEYLWGGYLLWSDIRVFIDGRVDMYGDDFFKDFIALHDLKKSPQDMANTFRYYNVTYVLMRPQSALAQGLRGSPAWREVYRDKTATVLVLTTASNLPAVKPA